jgi:hypothetical protein
MTTTLISTSCRCCGHLVEDAMHLMLCDDCLDARLAELEPIPAPALFAARLAALERPVLIAV